MLDINRNNIRELLSEGLVRFNMVFPITKKSHFCLASNLSVELSNNVVVIIPSGFKFDGSSSPRFLWWAFPSYGDFFFASLIHDYLYQTADLSDDKTIKEGKLFADKEMLLWSTILNNRNIGKMMDNYLRYYAVKWFGKKVYIT